MLSSLLLIAALNRLLEREAWARQTLLEHAGHTALLEIAGIALRFKVDERGTLSTMQDDSVPTVSIELPATALPHLLDGVDAFSRYAHVSGDAHFAESIARLLRHLRPDLGASLSPFLGDIAAHRLEQGLNAAAVNVQGVARNLGANIFEYVSEERALVVKRSELESRDAELARLQEDLERLEKRIARIASR